jgi:D-alanyl-D-alanine carboxypeptidase
LSTRDRGRSELPVSTAEATSTTHRSAFDGLSLEAKAVYVVDVRDDETLYAYNSDAPLPLASITKLLTALVAAGNLPSDTVVTVTSEALATEGESGLLAGEAWDLHELIAFMLVTSSNDAAAALKGAYQEATGGSFVAAMNKEAGRFGMTDSAFTNETGLDIGTRASNTGTARDAAKLLAAALRVIPEALDATRKERSTFVSKSGNVHDVKNTNALANSIPWSVGAKTGFTDTAGGNLVISFDTSLGHPVVIAVLGSSREGRFTDMERLVRATLAAMQTP